MTNARMSPKCPKCHINMKKIDNSLETAGVDELNSASNFNTSSTSYTVPEDFNKPKGECIIYTYICPRCKYTKQMLIEDSV